MTNKTEKDATTSDDDGFKPPTSKSGKDKEKKPAETAKQTDLIPPETVDQAPATDKAPVNLNADIREKEQALKTTVVSSDAMLSVFSNDTSFALAQRMAQCLAASSLVPQEYHNNLPNCVIALEMAQRIGASALAVMQSLYIVHGKPGWSAQFIIASLNSCGRYSPLRFKLGGEGDSRTCVAQAIELASGEVLEGTPVSIEMAKAEGWFQKKGSKWQTMPEQMLRYRAASFFGKLYAPEILMGMSTSDELHDIIEGEIDDGTTGVADINKAVNA